MANVDKSMFVAHNSVHLCGKIIRIESTKKNEVRFMLSCGHGKKQRKDKNGKIERDLIAVIFFDEAARKYKERFVEGDFVTVNAVAQTIRDHYNGTSYVEIWGLSMGPKFVRGKMIPDHNRVNIRGKITSAVAMSDNYILMNVLTAAEKSRPNPNEDSEIKKLTETYKSITPIGIRCNGNAKTLAKQYTEGTWVDCSGFIDDRVVDRDEFKKRVYRIISLKTTIIGEVQRVFEKPLKPKRMF